MSRRLRKELEAAKEIKQDQEEEEDIYQVRKERIFAPVVWQILTNGIKIQDLKEDKFQLALAMLEEHYLPSEDLGRNVDLMLDETSVQYSVKRLQYYIKEGSSLIAVTEDGEVVGLLILRTAKKNEFARVFSRAQITEGESLKKCLQVKNYINRKVDVYEHFNVDAFLRFYAVCIAPTYRKKALGFTMMKCGVDVARSLKMPVILGIFTNFKLQKLAKRLGMEVIKEVNYVDWRDEQHELIFSDPGPGNYTIALMACYTPPAPIKPRKIPERIIEMELEEAKKKKTRMDKRAELVKAGLYTRNNLLK
ncbi:uncharacterized protein LOC108742207 isoform X1 [Agrilus planipennis]|uniref:Uncharacterized protein LOC108742207 isoform X1 n=1 Tax=Agrilus planipennis TaxID=224129 RepID=A0A1W4X9T9_AGRPL|nr:uncharacterized protein LOC108742207 isoform X1 [Agrilus planipennis]XP_025830924.1 uncharacterized protein LOC108742207 isoform X1 [Agrilus planipennis]XP_025830925.1 uncharacterized protein LOC108742207 isoform X1 [Agrilus planipennis]XP_025830926.1 uncharacterized protein LOC108742207 isoform X1 [Agrilus planipennis]XP_025830927.1 uncharacterized protein LOC108742207 isoform X1 [Agrilus planipennis]XP_025830928.1 uncharacterized protein LOC108742207 isoform X1 [Agrilus planipennis]